MFSPPEAPKKNSSKYKFGQYGGSNFGGDKSRGMDATFGSFSGQAFTNTVDNNGQTPTESYGVSFGRSDDLITATAKHSLSQIREKWVQDNKALVASTLAGSLQIPGEGPIGVIFKSLTDTIGDNLSKIFDAEVGNCVKTLKETVEAEYSPGMKVKAAAKIEDELWVAKNANRLQKEYVGKKALSWRQAYEDQNRDAIIQKLKVSERPKVVALLSDGYEPPELADLKDQYVDDLLRNAQSGAEVVKSHKMGDEMSAVNRMLYSTSSTIRTYCVHALGMFADQIPPESPIHEQHVDQKPPRSPIDERYDDSEVSIKVEEDEGATNQVHQSTPPSSPSEVKPAAPSDSKVDASSTGKRHDLTNVEENSSNKEASAGDYESENDTELCSINDPRENLSAKEVEITNADYHDAAPEPENLTPAGPPGTKRKRIDDDHSTLKKARMSPDTAEATVTDDPETAGRKPRVPKAKRGSSSGGGTPTSKTM